MRRSYRQTLLDMKSLAAECDTVALRGDFYQKSNLKPVVYSLKLHALTVNRLIQKLQSEGILK